MRIQSSFLFLYNRTVIQHFSASLRMIRAMFYLVIATSSYTIWPVHAYKTTNVIFANIM